MNATPVVFIVMDTLPDEMLLHLTKFVQSTEDLTRLSMVCQRLYGIITEDDAIWQVLHVRLYGPPLHTKFAEYRKTWRWLCLARRKPVKCRFITPASIEVGSRGGIYRGDVCVNGGFSVPHGYGYWHLKDEETLEGEWKRGAMHGRTKASRFKGQVKATAEMVSGQPITDSIRGHILSSAGTVQYWVEMPRSRLIYWSDAPDCKWVHVFPSVH